jgi:hypothetical protein
MSPYWAEKCAEEWHALCTTNKKKETNLRQTYNLFGYNVSNHPIF